MIDIKIASDLRNRRVLVTFEGSARQDPMIFRSLTPSGQVILAAERTGQETWVSKYKIARILAAPIKCPDCGGDHEVDRESQRCADCERAWASEQPASVESCADCGDLGAVYSPRAGRFLCPQCHAKGGTFSGLGTEARVLTQRVSCLTDDIHSDRHDWRRAKSSYLCKLCYTKVFERPAGYLG